MLDKKPSHKLRTTLTIVFSVVVFVLAGWLLLNKQYAMDQVSVWAYQAPDSVEVIEDRIKLTNKGRFYFYTAQPMVADAESFNANCPRREIGSPILGCYAMQRIYIYDVENEKLNGIEEVTAAHEMLHAAWDRLSDREQKRLGVLLEETYDELGDGEELKERMAYYARTEPGEFHNELHAIVGTEMAEIGDELEAYYARYFTDRQVIIELHSQYDSVFGELQAHAEGLFTELSALAMSIETRTARYNTDVADLSTDIQAFNARASANGFTTIAQFNQERNALVARSNQLDADRAAINDDIESYNIKYEEYQSVAVQIESLNKSIDSIKALDAAPTLQPR